jgi:uncharacterized protein (TIGR02246 family)
MKASWSHYLAALGLCWLGVGMVRADQAAEEAAIRKSIESYSAAYNKGDAKTVASHWLPTAVYVDPDSGRKIEGRLAIEKHFATMFARNKAAKLAVKVQSIQFVSPHVAVERGTAKVVGAGGEPSLSKYTAVHVKSDGKWHLDRVTEEDEPALVSHRDKLKDLEWLIGDWVDNEDALQVETACQWSKNQNFIIRSFSVSKGDRVERSGLQIIGWDPVSKHIHSWGFNSDGGFGEGLWSKKGNRWYIQTKDTLPDGQKATSQNILTVINKDAFSVQSVNRQAGGDVLPNIDEVVMVRRAAAK